ncbi:hypothetical protein B0F88_101388 [Methylobacter tundripaludum]|uniref:Uncharacterized protein n=1 Tax=Methylobacter tundripaludum TaxID=173365 RepID=A0A2S6H8W7_9GAMM|nr:hypothetical protein B0F88_101388 [Methylobacter tundripaludum]
MKSGTNHKIGVDSIPEYKASLVHINCSKLPLLGNRSLRCSISCILAVVLTPLTYIIHRDVVNADIAGANICPCRQSQL